MRFYAMAALAAALSGCSVAPTRPDAVRLGDEDTVKAYLSKLINHEMRQGDVPGLSIALVDDQRVVWSQGFGYADQERRTPASAETIYRVGSISKLFTDMAALQLAEQGRLNVDLPVQTYLPNFSIKQRNGTATAITPRMLMTHHAGLPRDILKGFMTTAPEPFSHVVDQLRDEYADYPPGQTFSYSNLGITVLGSVVEQLSGEPFAARMQREVLLPMGMTHSAFETGVSSSALMAKGY
ncbi:MAG: beta-lactamase family protein, partial [Burkholderiales bacterium]|nr:beta-lactamase family protein [Burkholderiales bacterium]